MTTTAYLCLGANLGIPREALALAARMLEEAGLVVTGRSSLYRTPPWGPIPQPDYLNQVLEVQSPVPARALLALALAVERRLGRNREKEERFGPRLIDIDILLFGNETIADADLILPHPRLLERAFALIPLVEIAPNLLISGIKATDALERLDRSGIARVP